MGIKGLTDTEKFCILAQSIGFKFNYGDLVYKEFKIKIRSDYFEFYDGSGWNSYNYNDLKPLEKYFIKKLRAIKLKRILE